MSTSLEERLARSDQVSAQGLLLELFRRTVQDVPAYQEFLTAQRVDPAAVKTYAEFARLPLLTKQNYMNAYPLPAQSSQKSGSRVSYFLIFQIAMLTDDADIEA
ncbi:MAG TPA: hypothetical protein VGD54_06735 [Steroidobacteraceae bacterium]